MLTRDGRDAGKTFLDYLRGEGVTKPSRAAREMAKMLSEEEFTRDELREIYDFNVKMLLLESTPAERREILATMDTCPCCDRWLGHNRPPDADDGDPPRGRQTSFDFDQ